MDAAVIALFTLVTGWIVFGVHLVGDYSTESDFYGAYAEGARRFQRGTPDPSRYGIAGPVYDLTVALVGFVTRELFVAAKVVSGFAAVAFLIAWRSIARATVGPLAATWLLVLVAVNPVFLRYAYAATTDMLAAALQAASLALMVAGGGRRSWFWAGVLAALAGLTRYTALVMLPVGVVLLLGRGVAGSGRRRALASFLGGFAAIAVPWTAFSLAAGFVPASGLFGQFGFYAEGTMQRNIQDQIGVLSGGAEERTSLLEYLRRDPLALARRWVTGVPDHLARDARELLGWPAAALCAVGLGLALLRGSWRRLAPVALAGAASFLMLAPIFYSERYALPLAPAYLMLAAGATAWPWPWLERARWGSVAKLALVAIVVVASARASAALQRSRLVADPIEVVAAGRTLKAIMAPGDQVISRKGHIGYYSGAAVTAFPRVEELSELAAYAHRRGARFLYYSWYEAVVRPECAFLLDPEAEVQGLERVFATDRQAAVLYRIGPGFGRDTLSRDEAIRRRFQQARVLTRFLADSSVAPYHALLAAEALDRGGVAEAIEHAGKAIRWQPRLAMAWTLMGDAQWSSGRIEDARLAYANALALDPTDHRARLGLGRAERQLNPREQRPAPR